MRRAGRLDESQVLLHRHASIRQGVDGAANVYYAHPNFSTGCSKQILYINRMASNKRSRNRDEGYLLDLQAFLR